MEVIIHTPISQLSVEDSEVRQMWPGIVPYVVTGGRGGVISPQNLETGNSAVPATPVRDEVSGLTPAWFSAQ